MKKPDRDTLLYVDAELQRRAVFKDGQANAAASDVLRAAFEEAATALRDAAKHFRRQVRRKKR